MSIDDVHPTVIDELEAELGPDLRAARDATPLPVLGAALARVFEDGLPPVAAPAVGPSARRRMVRRIAVGATVAGFFTGGLGVAGALPGPVQRAVSDVADVVGVQLPHPADDEADPPADTPIVVPPTTVASTPPTSAVRPTPPTTVPPPPPSVDPDEGRGQEEPPGKGKDDDKGEKPPKEREPEPEVDDPEVELEQQGRGGAGGNGRTDEVEDDPVPATRGGGAAKGRAKGAVEDLLEVVEEPAPGA